MNNEQFKEKFKELFSNYGPLICVGLVFGLLIYIVVRMSKNNDRRHQLLLAKFAESERVNETYRERIDGFKTYVNLLEATVTRRNAMIKDLENRLQQKT